MKVLGSQGSVVSKRVVGSALCVMLFALPVSVAAQETTKIRRIGFLSTGFQPPKEFQQAMGTLGYVEGKNIVYENRAAEGRDDQLPELAAALLRLNVEVIVAPGAAAGLAAKQATKTVPVVYMGGGDPVEL